MVAIDAQRSFFEGSPDPHGARLQESLLIDRLVDLLVQKATTRVYWPEVYSHTVRLLKNAPLSTGQRLRVFRRIHNAEAYAEAGEFGAAAFELRLLRTQLA